MDYYDYRELRTLHLHSRLLRYQIDVEEMQAKPNRFRLFKLKKLRFTVLDRISGYLRQHESALPIGATSI